MRKKLTESNISECQSQFNLSYHVNYAHICEQLIGFANKDILEVGGSLPPDFVFEYLNVNSWSAIETPDYAEALQNSGGITHTGTIINEIEDFTKLSFANRQLEKYNLFLDNIENLPSEHYGKYDLIFSIAAFEHIHKFPTALEKMFIALKPGGKVFSMFSPIWSSFNGHHLPEITDKQGNQFNFSNSPIPPWGHLLMTPSEMCLYLYQFTDKNTAELMTYYIYNSPHINRFFSEDYIDFLKQSSFAIRKLELTFPIEINQDTQTILEKSYPGRKKFTNNGLLVVLEKNIQIPDYVQHHISQNKQNNHEHSSNSDHLIPPEIKNDEFYLAIQKIAKLANIKTVLEIGSSSGEGSTEAWVTGLRGNPIKPNLFCMEVSRTRFAKLQKHYLEDAFVKCYNVSSVSLTDFPEEQELEKFYNTYQTNLNHYPLEMVLGWLNQDKEYIKSSCVPTNGISQIKQENNIEFFDAVLIDGSEFTGDVELDRVYGAKYILLDDINTFKNYTSHRRLLADPNYTLIAQNLSVRNGYSIFQKNEQTITKNLDLPIHFFTIVLNGEPFIRYHINIFNQLPFKWHWHIIEGVADLKHDTAWSLQLGGKVTQDIHDQGRSNDGTSAYLDKISAEYTEQITIYRKPLGEFWDGKLEMVNAPLANIQEECLLWQIDVDELWTLQQICDARKIFIQEPGRTAAFYWCWYFVGEKLVISTRNCYAQNPQQEWLRTWRFKPGYVWLRHEPPVLTEKLSDGQLRNVATVNPFFHAETEKNGLVFQHFAYVTKAQLEFKEKYYGYQNAVTQWLNLQSGNKFPVLLREYLGWVSDQTMVDKSESLAILPIAQQDGEKGWQFIQPEYRKILRMADDTTKTFIILIDGVFFQMYRTGIARVWRSLLEVWAENGFAEHIIVLDRVGTAPKVAGVRYRTIPAYDYNNTDADRQMLQQVCDEEGADIFVSTYYTTPISTPSVFMAYDMIPEVIGYDVSDPMWREKRYGINHASSYIAISQNTANDLARLFTNISVEEVTVAHCGVDPNFTPATLEEIANFKYRYGITKPYFLLVGAGGNYKNAGLFFQAFSQLATKQGFDIVCTGTGINLGNEYRGYIVGTVLHPLMFSDEELRLAYAGAVALIYPSKYEGFGMPVAEAMACGCPVITCPNSSLPEVAGEAAIYVNDSNVYELVDALCEVQKPSVRNSLITAGLAQAQKFSWQNMAEKVSQALIEATLLRLNLREINLIIFPDWSQPEEVIFAELSEVIKTVASHPAQNNITLLIDNSNITGEEADLMLSSILMNLMMEAEIDVTETLGIVLIGELSDIQWQVLIPKLKARIILESENQEQISRVKLADLMAIKTDDILSYNFNG